MKFKKVFLIEILIIVIIFSVAVAALELTPFLQPSKQDGSIALYKQRSYPKSTISLASGESAKGYFNYTTYDPAIIAIEITFGTIEKDGYLDLYCNYRKAASIFVNPQTSKTTLNMFSVSGSDWVEPLSTMFGLNDLLFESQKQNGYAGTFTYQVILRGSR